MDQKAGRRARRRRLLLPLLLLAAAAARRRRCSPPPPPPLAPPCCRHHHAPPRSPSHPRAPPAVFAHLKTDDATALAAAAPRRAGAAAVAIVRRAVPLIKTPYIEMDTQRQREAALTAHWLNHMFGHTFVGPGPRARESAHDHARGSSHGPRAVRGCGEGGLVGVGGPKMFDDWFGVVQILGHETRRAAGGVALPRRRRVGFPPPATAGAPPLGGGLAGAAPAAVAPPPAGGALLAAGAAVAAAAAFHAASGERRSSEPVGRPVFSEPRSLSEPCPSRSRCRRASRCPCRAPARVGAVIGACRREPDDLEPCLSRWRPSSPRRPVRAGPFARAVRPPVRARVGALASSRGSSRRRDGESSASAVSMAAAAVRRSASEAVEAAAAGGAGRSVSIGGSSRGCCWRACRPLARGARGACTSRGRPGQRLAEQLRAFISREHVCRQIACSV